MYWNLWAAWIGIVLGMVAGALQGLRFHAAEWQGGYASWRRRLMRLGHISFFGLAFINLAFVLTLGATGLGLHAELPPLLRASSCLLMAGAALMPLNCYLAAWRDGWRHLFVLPVTSLLAGVGSLITWGVQS